MRLHELILCLIALFAPLTSVALFGSWWAPLIAFFGVSLPLIWLAGWLIDHTYAG